MKLNFLTFTSICIFLLSSSCVTAIEFSKVPERIVSITQVFHEEEYYISQVDLWASELDKDNKNADAWMNYYLACRIVNMLDNTSDPHDLDEIHNDLLTAIPDTYEFHYLTFLNGEGDPHLFSHIETAYAIDPNRTEVYSHMVNYYAVQDDQDQMKFFNEKWLASGEISSGILAWNYNSLMSVEPNGLLLTYGDNDTYPSWMLQQVHQVRPDVKVVNINLLRNNVYWTAVFEGCGIPKYDRNVEDEANGSDEYISIAQHIFEHSNRPVYINVTLPKNLRNHYGENLYTVGLAFKYSQENFDNITTLKDNYENKFLTDHLKFGFQFDKSVSVLNTMNMSYLPAFINLYAYYKEGHEDKKAEKIGQLITNIGIASGRETEVGIILGERSKPTRNLETLMDIKQIDKIMVNLQNGLWASSQETSNELYEQFLKDLLLNKEFDLLEKCKTTKVDWLALMPEKYKDLSEADAFSQGHPNYPKSPVQNISYEAAVAYCTWLTESYNNYSKKKNHQSVIFRLPTKEEWIASTLKYNKAAPYPWGGYYYKNKKGCYLANFYSSDEPQCEDCNVSKYSNDGAFFTVKTDSYFPNDFGLYNMSGNIAEMVKEEGIAMGGSWEDIPEECTNASEKKYDKPSPAIGFRVFMEIKN